MAKKNTKKSEDRTQISNFVGKLTEDDLAQCLSKSPRSPKVKKNGTFSVTEKFVSFMGWKPGAKLDIVTDADQGQIGWDRQT